MVLSAARVAPAPRLAPIVVDATAAHGLQVTTDLSPGERFLAAFHDLNPGVTSRAYQPLATVKGGVTFASSYACLASSVPSGETPARVLDMACGDGYLLSLLAARPSARLSLVGVDISQGELAAAGRRLGNAATLYRGRAQALPLADGSVDHVLCHMALMLMDQLELVLAEVRRVLKTGGTFAFTVDDRPPAGPAFDAWVVRLRAARARHPSMAIRFGDHRLAEPESIGALLSPRFSQLRMEDITITRRYQPLELWDWFEGMYDLHLLPATERAGLKTGYLADIGPCCDADGRHEFSDRLRQVSVVAA